MGDVFVVVIMFVEQTPFMKDMRLPFKCNPLPLKMCSESSAVRQMPSLLSTRSLLLLGDVEKIASDISLPFAKILPPVELM